MNNSNSYSRISEFKTLFFDIPYKCLFSHKQMPSLWPQENHLGEKNSGQSFPENELQSKTNPSLYSL